MRIVLLFSLLAVSLFAYTDSDLDGVTDELDRCPNTPMLALVDKNGCTVETLKAKSEHHADVSMGIGYDKVDSETDDKVYTIDINYYYGAFTANLYTVNYLENVNIYSKDDLYLSAYYQYEISDTLGLRFGTGVVLPLSDANGNETDYLLSAQITYQIDSVLLYAYYKYTFMNDLYSRNIHTVVVGAGYSPASKLYTILSFSNEQSIYRGYDDIRYLTLYNKYYFDDHWFGTLRLSAGLSDTANDFSTVFSIGYYF